MAKDKASFVVYSDLVHTIDHLTDEQAGKLFKLILHYVNDRKPPEPDDLILKIAFEPIKRQLKRDLKGWEQKRQKRSEAGKIGGIKSGESRRGEANEANASKSKQNEANEAVNVNGTVTVNVNDNVTVIKKERKCFAPPPLDDVVLYMSESIDEFSAMGEAQKFINYYSSNGWMVGKNKMKNWRGAAAGWISRKDNFKNNDNGKQGTSAERLAAAKNF